MVRGEGVESENKGGKRGKGKVRVSGGERVMGRLCTERPQRDWHREVRGRCRRGGGQWVKGA